MELRVNKAFSMHPAEALIRLLDVQATLSHLSVQCPSVGFDILRLIFKIGPS